MWDVLNNLEEKTIKCLDKGFVSLIDVMPRMVPEDRKTADFAIVQAARVSYGEGTKHITEDRGLIRYLFRHQHTTPVEMIEFKFCCKMPIFVARQWIRHRTANVNEYSGRYSVLKDEFYYPDIDNVRQQSKINKQGGDEQISKDTADEYLFDLDETCNSAYNLYKYYIDNGVTREQARMILPVNLYTEWYWKIDLHNLLHFLALRCDSHAQYEIRVFADAMLKLMQPIVPLAIEAWNDYHPMREALKLSRLEIEALKHYISWAEDTNAPDIKSDNKREKTEWLDKVKGLGLTGVIEL